jgi:hypothetical protein
MFVEDRQLRLTMVSMRPSRQGVAGLYLYDSLSIAHYMMEAK